MRGAQDERELVRLLWMRGFAVIRALEPIVALKFKYKGRSWLFVEPQHSR